jgi:hypothetical protein
MRFNLKHLLTSLSGTLILLLFLEIISTALLPAFGIVNYKIPVDVLIILYFGFRLETPYLALFILLIQFFSFNFFCGGLGFWYLYWSDRLHDHWLC